VNFVGARVELLASSCVKERDSKDRDQQIFSMGQRVGWNNKLAS